jgi:mannose-6-phosphate isomerase-like protein (cupin superfamily)
MHAKGARIDELPSLWDGFARLVRPGLGLSAFGANVMNLPPDYATKAHDESQSGQEELYVCLSGSGAVVLDDDGSELALDADQLAAVGPGVSRTLKSGPQGLSVLIIGGKPGEAYEPQDWSSQGE